MRLRPSAMLVVGLALAPATPAAARPAWPLVAIKAKECPEAAVCAAARAAAVALERERREQEKREKQAAFAEWQATCAAEAGASPRAARWPLIAVKARDCNAKEFDGAWLAALGKRRPDPVARQVPACPDPRPLSGAASASRWPLVAVSHAIRRKGTLYRGLPCPSPCLAAPRAVRGSSRGFPLVAVRSVRCRYRAKLLVVHYARPVEPEPEEGVVKRVAGEFAYFGRYVLEGDIDWRSGRLAEDDIGLEGPGTNTLRLKYDFESTGPDPGVRNVEAAAQRAAAPLRIGAPRQAPWVSLYVDPSLPPRSSDGFAPNSGPSPGGQFALNIGDLDGGDGFPVQQLEGMRELYGACDDGETLQTNLLLYRSTYNLGAEQEVVAHEDNCDPGGSSTKGSALVPRARPLILWSTGRSGFEGGLCPSSSIPVARQFPRLFVCGTIGRNGYSHGERSVSWRGCAGVFRIFTGDFESEDLFNRSWSCPGGDWNHRLVVAWTIEPTLG